jgi:hypothetical protein
MLFVPGSPIFNSRDHDARARRALIGTTQRISESCNPASSALVTPSSSYERSMERFPKAVRVGVPTRGSSGQNPAEVVPGGLPADVVRVYVTVGQGAAARRRELP